MLLPPVSPVKQNRLCRAPAFLRADNGTIPSSFSDRRARESAGHILACPFSQTPVSPRNLLEGLGVPETPVASLFDFAEERVETLAPGAFFFGQPSLKQTREAKSATHTQRTVTVMALGWLARDRGKRISEAVDIHFEGS
jgi:hypothetical protein